MFRITRRHSLATLAVLAGLFGAAPAIAAPTPFLVDGPYSAKAPSGGHASVDRGLHWSDPGTLDEPS